MRAAFARAVGNHRPIPASDAAHRPPSIAPAQTPASTFGWLQADLRMPLPPLADLETHPIGMRAGQPVYLCRHTHAGQFLVIEHSKEFSEHYGENVFICSMADARETA